MKKKVLLFVFLLIIAGLYFGLAKTTNASYQKTRLSERILMDSGRVNMVEWEKLNDSENAAFDLDHTNPHVTNLTGTGESMIIKHQMQ